jgi:multidrug efflux pump subunit AcrB
MWIVRLALRRPYTFAVFAILLLLIGAFSILTMPTDIFPNINIPVVSIVWQYSGLSAEEMANRIVAPSERSMTTTVNDIEHIESQSLNGIGVIKIFFQPHVDIGSAVAEVTSISQVQLRPAARHHAAFHHPVQRLQRSRPATRSLRAGPQRAATGRHRPTSSAPASLR